MPSCRLAIWSVIGRIGLAWGMAALGLFWLLLFWMYRNKVFLKV